MWGSVIYIYIYTYIPARVSIKNKLIREPDWPVATVSKMIRHTHTHVKITAKVTCATSAIGPRRQYNPHPYSTCWEPKSLQLRLQDNAHRSAEVGGNGEEVGNAVQRTGHRLHEAHQRRQRGGIICATAGHTASSVTTAGEGGKGGGIIASSAREGGAISR